MILKMGFIDIRYCKKCGKAYDIGTNFDLCLECRKRKNSNEKIII